MKPNTIFPGLPGYTGPTAGMFACLHHEVLCEYSPDVTERITYVREHKPKREIDVRLRSMVYLDPVACPEAQDYMAKRARLDAPISAYLRAVQPDHAWNGSKVAGT